MQALPGQDWDLRAARLPRSAPHLRRRQGIRHGR